MPQIELNRSLKLVVMLCILLTCQGTRAAAPLRAMLTCDTQPIEAGITLHREGIGPKTVNVGGEDTQAWVSGYQSVPADAWARSFCMTLTDDRLRNGKMPSVDIELTFLLEANTKVELLADTNRGNQVIASGWGNKHEWQTLHCHLDDAYFGARNPGNDPKKLPVDGFDLRLNGWAGDLYLRKVVVTAHDPANPDDWSAFLKLTRQGDDAGLVLSPGASSTITLGVANTSKAKFAGVLTYQLMSGDGKKLRENAKDVAVEAGASSDVSCEISAGNLPTGDYALRAFVCPADDPGQKALTGEWPVVVAGPNDLFIVFDKTPLARGIDFDRTNVSPREIEVNGIKRWIWAGGPGSQRGADGWWHSILLKVTDEKFTNARHPVVDLNVRYRHVPNAPVTLFADTASGSRQIGFGWGRNENWQSMNCQLDDALFNHTDYKSNPKDLKTDGFDLRFNACVGDAEVSSVFIHAYDLDQNPDYQRCLRFDGLDAGRDLYVFSPGEKQDLQIKLRNLANVPVDTDYILSLQDDLQHEVWHRTGNAKIEHGNFVVPVSFDTQGLRQGVYTVDLNIGRSVEGRRQEVFHSQTNVMVSDQEPIERAADGEFLYGLDTGVHYQDEGFLKWLDFMGVDITRGNEAGADTADWGTAFTAMKRHHVRSSVFFDVPWDPDPLKRQQKVDEVAQRASAAVKDYPSDIFYIEMGNEPDLDFFYPGPIEDYTQGFTQIARAIKQANPHTCVMNGGLSFAGQAGDARSRKFIAEVPADAFDAIAYHGHGPGAAAERAAYERVHAEAVKDGKGDKIFIETESGVAASTPAQLRIQARTAVEKEVYAQSVHLPLLMYFRLYITGGDEAYTNLKNEHEPRPAILSYRTMVKSLRHLIFDRMLDLGADAEGYLFSQHDGERRALVCWANLRAGGTQLVRLGAAASDVSDVQLVDLFGNSVPVQVSASGTVNLPVELDPAFLTWKSRSPADAVAVLASPMQIATDISLTPGTADTIKVKVYNSMTSPMDATLVARTGSASDIKVTSGPLPLHVDAGSSAEVEVPVRMAEVANQVSWPQRWTVFTDVPPGLVDLTKMREIPAAISGGGKTIQPRSVRLKDGRIDLASLAGGYKEHKEAIAFAYLNSPRDQKIQMGGSADWWMQWCVNGRLVFDDLETGNGTGQMTVLDHPFTADVKQGRNLLAVRVVSGMQGWKLVCGGPEEILSARSASTGDSDSLQLELLQGDVLLARKQVSIQRRHILQPLPRGVAWDGELEAYENIDPDGELTEEGVENEWAKQPDSSRWWHGEADLSGRIWLRADGKKLYVLVAVRDDVHHPATDAATIDAGDSLRIAAAANDGTVLQLGVPGQGNTVYRRDPSGVDHAWKALDPQTAEASVTRYPSGTTWYRIALNRSHLPEGPLCINVAAQDDDFGGHKQSDSWYAGINAAHPPTQTWYQAALSRAGQGE